MSCNKIPNNKYYDCPARMSGNDFTDYRSSTYVDDSIRHSNNITNNFDYRNFLTRNAVTIMKINNEYEENKFGCKNCNAPEIPFFETCVYNSISPKCALTSNTGLGLRNTVSSMEEYMNIEHFSNQRR